MILRFVLFTGSFCWAALLSGQVVVDSFNYTGGVQTFVVPCGVTSVFLECYGAQGSDGAAGGGGAHGGYGGLGGYVSGTRAVTAGQTLYFYVGGASSSSIGGYNGGGNGGNNGAGGGGGASDIRIGGTTYNDRILVAGGGGGGGTGGCESAFIFGGNGGSGNNQTGMNGTNSSDGGGGQGGTGLGGSPGTGCSSTLGASGTANISPVGGDGGAGATAGCPNAPTRPGGGGGGGGWFGGPGGGGGSAGTVSCTGYNKGGGGGGAGGSELTSGVTAPVVINNARTGNGLIRISYTDPLPTPVFSLSSVDSLCATGGYAGFYVQNYPGATSYTWSVPGCVSIVAGWGTNAITTMMGYWDCTTVISVTATTPCGTSPAATFTFTAVAMPVITVNLPIDTVCFNDGLLALSGGSPPGGYWTGSAVGSGYFNPAAATIGNNNVVYHASSIPGCEDSVVATIYVDLCMGQQTSSGNVMLSVAPNPATDFVSVIIPDEGYDLVVIRDLGGRVVVSEPVRQPGRMEITLNDMDAGTYILTLEGSSGVSSTLFTHHR